MKPPYGGPMRPDETPYLSVLSVVCILTRGYSVDPQRDVRHLVKPIKALIGYVCPYTFFQSFTTKPTVMGRIGLKFGKLGFGISRLYIGRIAPNCPGYRAIHIIPRGKPGNKRRVSR